MRLTQGHTSSLRCNQTPPWLCMHAMVTSCAAMHMLAVKLICFCKGLWHLIKMGRNATQVTVV